MMARFLALILGLGLVGGAAVWAAPALQQPGCQRFPETGYTVCGPFLAYWQAHGGLAQQGYPISDEFSEVSELDGRAYTVQYFERAVFERHPENAPPYDVLLAQLGTYQYTRKYPAATASPAAGGDGWATLRARPLALPTVTAGSCPTTPGGAVAPAFGAALGRGPFYPVGLGTDGVLHYQGSVYPGPWLGQKVLWLGDAAYGGPVLVRGRRLDGSDEVRFGPEANPAPELRLDPATNVNSAPGWHDWPAITRVRGAGCYAYQVDGAGFSQVIVFRAAP